MITSCSNQRVKKWLKYRQKKYRQEDQRMIIEEQHLIEESNKQHLLETIILLENEKCVYNDVETVYVSKEVMRKLSTNTSLNKMIAISKFPSIRCDTNRILLLDGIQIPGNMGAILRSAYAFGFKKVYISKDCVDIYNEKVIQSSQGAIFHLEIIETDLLQLLKNVDYPIYATGFKNSVELKQVEKHERMGIILGNEGNGVSDILLQNVTGIINIQMQAFDSLNVAMAGAICMYYLQSA